MCDPTWVIYKMFLAKEFTNKSQVVWFQLVQLETLYEFEFSYDLCKYYKYYKYYKDYKYYNYYKYYKYYKYYTAIQGGD